MKNKLLKYYIVSFLLLCNIAMYAQPGNGNDTNDLEGADAPAPIDNYIYFLALIAIIYGFIKFKTFQNKYLHN